MAKRVLQYEERYPVYRVSREVEGARIDLGWYMARLEAEKACSSVGHPINCSIDYLFEEAVCVLDDSLWGENDPPPLPKWYLLGAEIVEFWHDPKEVRLQALAKLTEEEKKVLGLCVGDSQKDRGFDGKEKATKKRRVKHGR